VLWQIYTSHPSFDLLYSGSTHTQGLPLTGSLPILVLKRQLKPSTKIVWNVVCPLSCVNMCACHVYFTINLLTYLSNVKLDHLTWNDSPVWNDCKQTANGVTHTHSWPKMLQTPAPSPPLSQSSWTAEENSLSHLYLQREQLTTSPDNAHITRLQCTFSDHQSSSNRPISSTAGQVLQ